MSKTCKAIVEGVLTPARTRDLWTANFLPALPFTPQGFDVGAMLPAILYMARWGHRRGKGTFRKTFEQEKNGKTAPPNAQDVVAGLMRKSAHAFIGFDDATGPAQLADLLLTYCLENQKHSEGHETQVQRIFATHYLASHVDLPDYVAHLRGVPELLTAILAWSSDGDHVLSSSKGLGRFVVGNGFKTNPLLRLFARNMSVRSHHISDLGSDIFDETGAIDLGIDELLAVRVGQACGRAPDRAHGKGDADHRIPNRWPIANAAAKHLREDLTTFIEVYGSQMPRQAFLPMLESGIALGLTNMLLSTTHCLFEWERTGNVPSTKEDGQVPWPLFVDASQGQDSALRGVSEAVMSGCAARFERVPVILMVMRLLDDRARYDRKLKSELPTPFPDARPRLNLLGSVLHERHERSDVILDGLDQDGQRLAEALTEEAPEVMETLQATNSGVVQRLAQALVDLMGDKQQGANFRKTLESSLMTDHPNGLATKRRVSRIDKDGRRKSVDLRAIVLTNSMLDFLVHRHLRKDGKGKMEQVLSFKKFLEILRTHYGLYVDREPPGFSVAQDLLRTNKRYLECRLRDLGLLVGVNDAESMKQLRARFEVSKPVEGEADAAA